MQYAMHPSLRGKPNSSLLQLKAIHLLSHGHFVLPHYIAQILNTQQLPFFPVNHAMTIRTDWQQIVFRVNFPRLGHLGYSKGAYGECIIYLVPYSMSYR